MTHAIRPQHLSRILTALGAALLLGACADAGQSPSPPSSASASSEASATALATATPEPTPSSTPELLEPSAYGARATVLVDSLRLRQSAGLGSDVTQRLEGGTEVRLMEGPVIADGFRWYWVSYGQEIKLRYPGPQSGWVAEVAVDASGGEEGDPFIAIDAPTCPPAVDAEMLANLSLYAIDRCDVQVASLHGLIDLCIEGPFTPWRYQPEWVWFSCPYLRDETIGDQQGWFLPIAFPPEMEQPERGDVVTLTGQIGFDEGQYGDCTVEAADLGPQDPASLDIQRQLWDTNCQLRFVVSQVTVEDHVEIPPLGG